MLVQLEQMVDQAVAHTEQQLLAEQVYLVKVIMAVMLVAQADLQAVVVAELDLQVKQALCLAMAVMV